MNSSTCNNMTLEQIDTVIRIAQNCSGHTTRKRSATQVFYREYYLCHQCRRKVMQALLLMEIECK